MGGGVVRCPPNIRLPEGMPAVTHAYIANRKRIFNKTKIYSNSYTYVVGVLFTLKVKLQHKVILNYLLTKSKFLD